jgi:hypothetical protein
VCIKSTNISIVRQHTRRHHSPRVGPRKTTKFFEFFNENQETAQPQHNGAAQQSYKNENNNNNNNNNNNSTTGDESRFPLTRNQTKPEAKRKTGSERKFFKSQRKTKQLTLIVGSEDGGNEASKDDHLTTNIYRQLFFFFLKKKQNNEVIRWAGWARTKKNKHEFVVVFIRLLTTMASQ